MPIVTHPGPPPHHSLKIWPEFYKHVKSGLKTFEYRKNDRGFMPGEIVQLNEFDPDIEAKGFNQGFTGRRLQFEIGYVLPVPGTRYVVFSLLPIEKKEEDNK